jgi:hypothetical protein
MMIYYTGIGAKPSGLHTPEEFVRVMMSTIDSIDHPEEWNGYELPYDFELFTDDDWVEYSGAIYI